MLREHHVKDVLAPRAIAPEVYRYADIESTHVVYEGPPEGP